IRRRSPVAPPAPPAARRAAQRRRRRRQAGLRRGVIRARRIDWRLLPLAMVGGAVGVLARYLLTIPWPDVGLLVVSIINLVGSLLLGTVAATFAASPRIRTLLGTGLLG